MRELGITYTAGERRAIVNRPPRSPQGALFNSLTDDDIMRRITTTPSGIRRPWDA